MIRHTLYKTAFTLLSRLAQITQPHHDGNGGGGGNPGKRRGAPTGNTNAQKTGFYSSQLTQDEIADLVAYAAEDSLEDEIAIARVGLRRLLEIINNMRADDDPANTELTLQAIDMMIRNTGNVSRLLRQQHLLSGAAADGLIGAVATALDELSAAWGVDL